MRHYLLLYGLELETEVHEVFSMTEKAPTRAFSWLKAATPVLSFKNLISYYDDCET